MPISDRELEHIRRKQREFLDALLVRKWTTPRRPLGEQDALEVGRKVGLMPILVCEFLHYWVGSGDLDESWTPIAVKIQKSLGDNAFEQIEAGFPQDLATLMVPGGTEGTQGLVFLCHASEDKPAVRDYAARLAEAGFTTWLDEEALLPGQDCDVEIRKAIERSCAVIVFLSARTQKRDTFKRKLRACLMNPIASPKELFF